MRVRKLHFCIVVDCVYQGLSECQFVNVDSLNLKRSDSKMILRCTLLLFVIQYHSHDGMWFLLLLLSLLLLPFSLLVNGHNVPGLCQESLDSSIVLPQGMVGVQQRLLLLSQSLEYSLVSLMRIQLGYLGYR